MPRIPYLEEGQVYKPELAEDDEDRMTIKMQVGDRRVLEHKARVARQSPTKWLVDRIHESPARPSEGGNKKGVVAAIANAFSFVLDRRRESLAETVAQQLGFVKPEDLARELMRHAIDNPDLADEFLFGNLRARLKQREAETPKPLSSKQSQAA